MSWPTHTIEIDEFPGWTAEIVDLAVGEVPKFNEAVATGDFARIMQEVLPLVQSWTFVDRAGDLLPLTAESIEHLPLKAARTLFKGVMGVLNTPAFPKAPTTSTTD